MFFLFPVRSVLQRLQQENQAFKANQPGVVGLSANTVNNLIQEEEEECSAEEDEELVTLQMVSGKRGPPCAGQSNESGKRHCRRPCSLDLTSHPTQTVT